MLSVVKVVGSNGQISLGKRYAGRQVLIEEQEPGVLLIRAAQVIPDNERWLHEPKVAQCLTSALAWANSNPTKASDLDSLEAIINDPSC
jgi:hypothetical protein